MTLKNISTKELVNELRKRKGVQTLQNKLYHGYNVVIVKKYSQDREPVQIPINVTVLVIEDKARD
ncbi:BC1881 family protein [Clostridium sp. FP1]|uniref:BC1881 family protein n=1 Tax=Clostridium sp. FP1 TaxID=2724076 RepID=UPI0013E9973C|nr:BC1881 family protein [Clostridium sp. FP1]MBZ9633031.1 BC1881 family protein [Clostridium sp. FP1]